MKANITYRGHPEALRKHLNSSLEHGLERGLVHWHQRHAPTHFSERAAARYGYAKRSEKYLRRKRKAKGHTRPLDFSGRAKRMLLSYMRVSHSRKSQRHRSEGAFWAPAYFWKVASNQPDKPGEFSRMTGGELGELARVVDSQVQHGLNAAARESKRRRIG